MSVLALVLVLNSSPSLAAPAGDDGVWSDDGAGVGTGVGAGVGVGVEPDVVESESGGGIGGPE